MKIRVHHYDVLMHYKIFQYSTDDYIVLAGARGFCYCMPSAWGGGIKVWWWHEINLFQMIQY